MLADWGRSEAYDVHFHVDGVKWPKKSVCFVEVTSSPAHQRQTDQRSRSMLFDDQRTALASCVASNADALKLPVCCHSLLGGQRPTCPDTLDGWPDDRCLSPLLR